MQRWYNAVVAALIILPGLIFGTAELLAEPREYLWRAEFNEAAGSLPDSTSWRFEEGDGTARNVPGWGNEELQTYTPEHAAMDGDGHLVIRAEALAPDSGLDCYYGPCAYASARLTTNGLLAFQYGRVEARMRVPGSAGTWPALWSLGNDFDAVSWPAAGELDIAEFFGKSPRIVVGALHGPGFFGRSDGTKVHATAQRMSSDFHVYGMVWTPERVAWTFDGHEYGAITTADIPASSWVFDKLFFLNLNLAMGGQFGGSVPETFTSAELLVDWIRISTVDGHGAVLAGNRVLS